jgi:hypothetical protein
MASASLLVGDMPHASPTSSETPAPGHHNPAQDELTILPQFEFTLEEVDYLNLALLDDDDEEEEAAADRIAAADDDDDVRFQEEADDVAHAARN